MPPKLVRITTIPLSLEKLLEGQLTFMNEHYEVIAVAAEEERLNKYGKENKVRTFWVEMTREITPVKDLKAVMRLYFFLRKERPVIVHTHTPKAGIVGMLAAKMAGVPIRLHTVAGMPLMETTGTKRKILNTVEKFTYQLATKVYPNSHGLQKVILNEGFASEDKLKVLGKGSSNGIDTNYFDPGMFSEEDRKEKRAKLGIAQEDLVFIFVGRLVKEKGINELVAAFSKLNELRPQTSLLLVGPYEQDLDPLLPQTMKIIQNHQKIFTTGFQQDVRPYFAISDVLTFPSYREGFPNVVMQAGAMGIPSIVTDINGCNEIIQQEVNGLIIPVKDEDLLYEAMEELSKDKELRTKLASGSRSVITDNYEREYFWNSLLIEYQLQITKIEVDPLLR